MTVRDILAMGPEGPPVIPVAPMQILIAKAGTTPIIFSIGVDETTDTFNNDTMFTMTGVNTSTVMRGSPDFKNIIIGELNAVPRTKAWYRRDQYQLTRVATINPATTWSATAVNGSAWNATSDRVLTYQDTLIQSPQFVVDDIISGTLNRATIPSPASPPTAASRYFSILPSANEIIVLNATPGTFNYSYDLTTLAQNGLMPFGSFFNIRGNDRFAWSDKWQSIFLTNSSTQALVALYHPSYGVNTVITFPAVSTTANAIGEVDPTGDYLFLGRPSSTLTAELGSLYKQTSTSVITLIKAGFGIATASRTMDNASWSAGGKYLAIEHHAAATPTAFTLDLWKRTGDTMTKVDSTTYNGTGWSQAAGDMVWSCWS